MILAGGIGSRFWPASTPQRPKQLLALASDSPLIEDTVRRALLVVGPERIRILTGADMVGPFRDGLPSLPADAYLVEPRARGTGPVLAWAAHRIAREDPDGVMISLHADHLIEPAERLAELLGRAAALAAEEDLLLTVAVPPDRPETGYGWIRPGAVLRDSSGPNDPGLRAWRVGAFVEKPDLPTAERYLAEGLLWNSGIFVWRAATFLEEVHAHAPEIGPHLALLDRDDVAGFFDAVTPVSVDEAVLERSPRVGAVEATFRWDDVGSWDALARALPPDADGNVRRGAVHAVEAHRNVVWSEEGDVVLFGVEDHIVIRAGGVTVVAPRSFSPRWKDLLDHLPTAVRDRVQARAADSPLADSPHALPPDPPEDA